ncbi:MAG TPA: hypothetical protein VHQ00_08350 [Chloroflexota bacterium]|nr:hypothetical protein [Chloroflexota bacterium]
MRGQRELAGGAARCVGRGAAGRGAAGGVEVVPSFGHARRRGLTTICLTAVPGSPAAQRADIRLVAFGQQTALGFGQFASRVAAATLLDALAAAVAWCRRDEAVAHATELVEVMQRRHTVGPNRAGRPGRGSSGARGGQKGGQQVQGHEAQEAHEAQAVEAGS